MNEPKKLVTYEDVQEALRLTTEAESKAQVSSGQEVTARSATLRVVETFAASLKQVSIVERKPFRGQAYADLAITHTEHAAQLLHIVRGTNDAQARADALRDALKHLEEARRMTAVSGAKVNEELQREPGKFVKLSDDFDRRGPV